MKYVQIIIIFVVSLNVLGYGEPRTVFVAKAIQGESLKSLLNNRYKISNYSLINNKLFLINKMNNPQVLNKSSMKKGETIFIIPPRGTSLKLPSLIKYVKYPVVKKNIYKGSKTSAKPGPVQNSVSKKYNKSKLKLSPKSKSSFSLFYTVSQGKINDEIFGESNPVKASLNSVLTIGGIYSYKKDDDGSVSISLYYSALNPFNSSNTGTLDPHPEIGFNIYQNQQLRSSFGVYYGMDFERSPIYNNYDLYLSGGKLELLDQNMLFATAGVFQKIRFLSRFFFFKAGASLSLWSNNLLESKYTNYKYKGVRYLLYVNTTLYKNIVTHFLYKHHDYFGASNITLDRFGFGIGYKF